MRIENSSSANVGGPSRAQSPAGGRLPEASPQAAQDGVPHLPDPELTRLAGLVRSLPETRPDAVQAVAQRLAQGDYETSEAAGQAAAAFLAE